MIRAYPEANGRHREVLVIENFVRGLTDPDTRTWVQLKSPETLEEAITLLIHYESVTSAIRSDRLKKPRDTAAAVEDREPPKSDSNKKTEDRNKFQGRSSKSALADSRKSTDETIEQDKRIKLIESNVEKVVETIGRLAQAVSELKPPYKGNGNTQERPQMQRYGFRRDTGRDYSDRRTLRQEGRCFRCRETGHLARDCSQNNSHDRQMARRIQAPSDGNRMNSTNFPMRPQGNDQGLHSPPRV